MRMFLQVLTTSFLQAGVPLESVFHTFPELSIPGALTIPATVAVFVGTEVAAGETQVVGLELVLNSNFLSVTSIRIYDQDGLVAPSS